MTRRIIIAVAALVVAAAISSAQPEHNDTLRTCTWSLYLQGGISGYHGMRGPENQYTFDRTSVAPSFEMGFFFYPRPWIRFGLGGGYTYLKSADPDILKSTIVTPGYMIEGHTGTLTEEIARIQNRNFTNLAGLDLTMGINFAEIWRERKCQWFNVWASIGAGYMHGWNKYVSTYANDKYFISDDKTYSWTNSEVNSPESGNQFDAPYFPFGLSFEFDVIPQLSLALYGQYKYFPFNIQHTPTGIWTAGLGVRFNLVGGRFSKKKSKLDELEERLNYCEQHRRVDTIYVKVPVEAPAPVVPVQTGKFLEVDKPLSHFAVQIYAFRVYQHAPSDKIFHNDNPTIYKNGDLRRYVVFTGTLEEAKSKWYDLRKRYRDAFIVYIDDNGIVVPYVEK